MSDDRSRDGARARVWDTTREADRYWWECANRSMDREPVPARAEVRPDTATAGQPGVWRVTIALEQDALRPGAHLTVQVPSYWQLDLGRPVRIHPTVLHLARPEDATPGYACEARLELPAGVEAEYAVSYASYDHVIDIAIIAGEVRPGEEIALQLGSEEGSLLRAQLHAQRAVFHTWVDLAGDGEYRPVSSFPAVEVIGGYPRMLRLTLPSAAAPGEEFEAHVMALDLKAMNPASGYAGPAEIRDEAGETGVAGPIEFADPRRAIATARVTAPAERGVLYLTVMDRERGMMCRSNPCRVGGSPVYFGDLHGQNYCGQGTGDMDEYFDWARAVEGLDFCSWAGYDYRTPLTGGKFRERVVDVANRHNDEGAFVVLQAFEWSGHGGHRNVYTPADDLELHGGPLRRVPPDTIIEPGANVPSGAKPEYLWRALEGIEAITIPHHPKFLGRADWAYRNDAMQPVVEICSQWGISEAGGSHSVQAALLMGHRFGFIGGTDTHKGQPGHGPHGLNEGIGLAGVHAPELTRRAIFDAIRARRCYATDGPRTLLDWELTIDGRTLRMGEEGALTSGPRTISIHAAAPERIARVEVLRNCEVVHTLTPGERWGDWEWTDTADLEPHLIRETPFGDAPFAFYYVRVTQDDGRRAWGSPIWLSGAR